MGGRQCGMLSWWCESNFTRQAEANAIHLLVWRHVSDQVAEPILLVDAKGSPESIFRTLMM